MTRRRLPKCNTCKHCHPAPKSPQYVNAYGWCAAPKPFFINTEPLIIKTEMAGRFCPAHSSLTAASEIRDALTKIANMSRYPISAATDMAFAIETAREIARAALDLIK